MPVLRQRAFASLVVDLSKKHYLDLLGTEKSHTIVVTRRRKDDGAHRRLVTEARSLIYDKGL
jgi:hypothetical protein